MSIEHKCNNCALNGYECEECYNCKVFNKGYDDFFIPKEKLARQDERSKVFEELANSENICFKYNGETYHIIIEKE